MTPHPFARTALAGCVACAALVCTPAVAADYRLTGDIFFNTDVVRLTFSIGTPSSTVRLWTDSWQAGTNFDPTLALWAASGNGGYTLLAEVDDGDSGIGSGQGSFDAALLLPSLAAGQYLVTLAASPNFAVGPSLAAGFAFGGSAPIAIAAWTQPGSDPNAHDQKGGFWQVNVSGVDQAAVVPEPASSALWLLGLAGVVGARVRRRERGGTDPIRPTNRRTA